MADTGAQPSSTATNVVAAAEALFNARRQRRPIPPVRTSYGISDVAEAYQVQDCNTRRYLAEGRRLAGRKIGLTSKAVQQQLGVEQPDYGMLWADLGYGDGDLAPMSNFMQPKVEAEIAFIMGRGLAGEQIILPDVMSAVAYAVPAMEIVDSAIANWDIKLADTIADNASAGGYVLGESPRALFGLDLRLCGMILSRNGSTASLGVGAACLENPLNALMWLARKMQELGRPLEAGDIVLSGALGPMVPAVAGDRFTAEIQGFAPLTLTFGDAA